MVITLLIGYSRREPLPAFGHPPLRGEGMRDQSGYLASVLPLLLAPAPLACEERGQG